MTEDLAIIIFGIGALIWVGSKFLND